MELILLLSIYFLGLLALLPLRDSLPIEVVTVISFFAGAVIWTITAIVIILTPLNYSLFTLYGIFFLLSLLFLYNNHRIGHWWFRPYDLLWIFGASLLIVVAHFQFSVHDYSTASYDSIAQIVAGYKIIDNSAEGTAFLFSKFGNWGTMLVIMQGTSPLLGLEFLPTIQPITGILSLLVFYTFGYLSIRKRFDDNRITFAMISLTMVTLVSVFLYRFQFVYIHNSLPTSTYLFIAIVALWLANVERNREWIIIGMVGLSGYTFLRTETILFALIVISIFISVTPLRTQIYKTYLLSYLFLFLGWYIMLYAHVSATTILSSDTTLMIISAIIAGIAGLLLANHPFIHKQILPVWTIILLLVCCLVLLALFIYDLEHMSLSLNVLLENLLVGGSEEHSWGGTWLILALMMPLVLILPRIPYEKIWTTSIIIHFLFILLLVISRVPYRLGWADSANRIMTHILPVIFFYYLLKFSYSLITVQWSIPIENIAYLKSFKLTFGALLVAFGVVLGMLSVQMPHLSIADAFQWYKGFPLPPNQEILFRFVNMEGNPFIDRIEFITDQEDLLLDVGSTGDQNRANITYILYDEQYQRWGEINEVEGATGRYVNVAEGRDYDHSPFTWHVIDSLETLTISIRMYVDTSATFTLQFYREGYYTIGTYEFDEPGWVKLEIPLSDELLSLINP